MSLLLLFNQPEETPEPTPTPGPGGWGWWARQRIPKPLDTEDELLLLLWWSMWNG